jgi:hypothetical protein
VNTQALQAVQDSSSMTASQLYNAANGFVQMPTANATTTSKGTASSSANYARSFVQRRAPVADVDVGFNDMKSCRFANTHQ